MRILTDKDLYELDILLAAEAVRNFLKLAQFGETVSPPRTSIPLEADTLTVTAGADPDDFGFRIYSYRPGLQRDCEDQIVACWDRKTHRLKALAIGELLGAWRTGILGGIAYQVLAGQTVETCGVIGTGLQAYTPVRAITALAKPESFLVFSRNERRRSDFAKRLQGDTGIAAIGLDSVESLVRAADALVVATNASKPVFKPAWLERCQHITTVGPKGKHRHEISAEVAKWADHIVSDSPQQIAKQGSDHFLADVIPLERISDLSAALNSDFSFKTNGHTLYLSAGLAGSEVALLAAISDNMERS